MKTILFILTFFLLNGMAFAQQKKYNYHYVDSLSYQYLIQEKWEELTVLGEAASKEKSNYYYFNLRVGIAYHALKKYGKATKFLGKALKNNSKSETAKIYLFWASRFLGDKVAESKYYKSLSEQSRKGIEYQPKKLLESVYLESGLKNETKRENLTYNTLGLNHKFSPRWSLYHAFSYLQQKLDTGQYKQIQYYFAPKYQFKKQWELGASLHYASLSADFNNDYNYTYQTEVTDEFEGVLYDYKSDVTAAEKNVGLFEQTMLFTNLSLSKTVNKFKFTVFGGTINSNSKNTYNSILTENWQVKAYLENTETLIDEYEVPYQNVAEIKTDTTFSQYHFGLKTGITLNRKFSGAIEILNISSNNKLNTVFIPTISYIISKKLNVTLSYLQKGNYPMAFANGSLFLNDNNDLQRFVFTTKAAISKKISLFLNYQSEKSTAPLSSKTVQSNLGLLGVKFHF